MKSLLHLSTMSLALLLTLAFSVGQPATAQQTPAKMDCATATEADIAKSIYEKISVKYADQKKHVNVSFKAGVVTLRGWVTTAAAKKAIVKFAKQTGCVKSVMSKLGVGAKTGCGPGMQKCGDICIPADETCNILMN